MPHFTDDPFPAEEPTPTNPATPPPDDPHTSPDPETIATFNRAAAHEYHALNSRPDTHLHLDGQSTFLLLMLAIKGHHTTTGYLQRFCQTLGAKLEALDYPGNLAPTLQNFIDHAWQDPDIWLTLHHPSCQLGTHGHELHPIQIPSAFMAAFSHHHDDQDHKEPTNAPRP